MFLRDDAVAPTYKQLRPIKAISSPTFPVYQGLADRLANTSAVPDGTAAHVLGTCAGYAYSDAATVAMIMARMGLEDNRCAMVAETVDAMFICSTAFVVQSKDGRVVLLCYRGTEPLDFINWLTDADVNPEKVRFQLAGLQAPIELHGGFYRNVRATRFAVTTALLRALEGRSVLEGKPHPERPMEALYVTGHSLGGAMAALMGVMLATDPDYHRLADKVKGVYTFGQPMIGDPEFAQACDAHPILKKVMARYVFEHDIVPELPPVASGRFAHFGTEYRLASDCHGDAKPAPATTQLTHLGSILGAPLAFLAHQLHALRDVPLQHSLYDHGPQHYIAALTPRHVRTEYGD